LPVWLVFLLLWRQHLLVQLLKFKANLQGFAKEVDIEYDNSDIMELSKQVSEGKIDKDLATKVEEIASKLKIVK
jgi:hypothetical protein